MQHTKSENAQAVLRRTNWIAKDVYVTNAETAGDGNMNLVERLYLSDGRTLILKRARAWVEKYPDIPAPVERANVEAAFYKAVASTNAGEHMPSHLGFDHGECANLYQDLGEGKDGMFAYGRGGELPIDHLNAVADWTSALHALPVSDDMRAQFDNKAMRTLNALHIFDFPLDPDNGFSVDEITPGLQSVADRLKADEAFVKAVKEVGALYGGASQHSDDVLLHGDLYPGSWIATGDGLFVIDPEFCWIGPAEWDLGVLIAHLKLSEQPSALSDQLIKRYGRPLNDSLLQKITGIEMMRRLIGVAQLPLEMDLTGKTALLDEARTLVTGSSL